MSGWGISGPSQVLLLLDQSRVTSAMLIWMDAWSLAPMILLLAELKNRKNTPSATLHVTFIHLYIRNHTHHLRGTYRSTNSPASFCIAMDLTSDRRQIWKQQDQDLKKQNCQACQTWDTNVFTQIHEGVTTQNCKNRKKVIKQQHKQLAS